MMYACELNWVIWDIIYNPAQIHEAVGTTGPWDGHSAVLKGKMQKVWGPDLIFGSIWTPLAYIFKKKNY